ncbi:DinB superfamily protein [Planococcus glaciei]|uniref:DinB family protein n=1 Tax=Planococcus glaciei TaxID=459472 RepID=UPI0008924FD9|nr:DinB family protein [Planococcus glaciei]SDH48409.1 DinB superfamily protein [Planococcus glaciei]
MTIEKLKESSTNIKSTINQMVSLLETTETSLLYKKPSVEEWSVMQIANHVIEAVEFWAADLEALLIVPGAKWGRNHEHVRRLAAVEEKQVKAVSKDEVVLWLQSLVPLTEDAFEKVQAEDLEKTAPSYNPNFDGKPLSFLIDHLIVKHIEGHLGQMERHLAKVQTEAVK